MHPGLIGGIAGTLIGLAGGVIGTCCSIRHTSSPRERRFVQLAAAAMWSAGLAFVAALLLLPGPWRWLAWIPWSVGLPLAIVGWNRAQQRIRDEETAGD